MEIQVLDGLPLVLELERQGLVLTRKGDRVRVRFLTQPSDEFRRQVGGVLRNRRRSVLTILKAREGGSRGFFPHRPVRARQRFATTEESRG